MYNLIVSSPECVVIVQKSPYPSLRGGAETDAAHGHECRVTGELFGSWVVEIGAWDVGEATVIIYCYRRQPDIGVWTHRDANVAMCV